MKNTSEEICTISLSKDWLDNDFTFYTDGKVINLCDKHPTKPNVVTELKAKELNTELKKKLLANCPTGNIEEIINLMSTK